ncbi:MAG: helix-turn-helix transcriptional regulator [Magnetococcales bacterium]|nr:helix-turn-helix transcriptional regulator [Magnetococcales bacterium]
MDILEQLAARYKALSEPLRIRLLCLVAHAEEICVCDLVTATGVSQSMVSRHLAYLRNSGWVTARRDKLWIHYRIARQADGFGQDILKTLVNQAVLSQQIQKDLQALKNIPSSGRNC